MAVNVLESFSNSQVLRTIGIIFLALHFHTDDLDRLIPCGETATESRSCDFLNCAQFLTVFLSGSFADTILCKTRQTKSGTPVCDLSNGHSVDTLIDTSDTLFSVNVGKGLESARRLDALGGKFVLGDLDRLHAGTETHGSVSLRKTTGHTTYDTGSEVPCAEGLGSIFGFRGDEKQDGTFRRGFDPGPRNETLIV